MKLTIETDRLQLIAGTVDIAKAEIKNRTELSNLVNAFVPESWPPELSNSATMAYKLDRLQEGVEQVGWWTWYIVFKGDPDSTKTLIGNVYLKGLPDSDGEVEISYAILDTYKSKGFATEAVQGLLGYLFENGLVRRVIAKTLPSLIASIRVLEKTGFQLKYPEPVEGTLYYEITTQ